MKLYLYQMLFGMLVCGKLFKFIIRIINYKYIILNGLNVSFSEVSNNSSMIFCLFPMGTSVLKIKRHAIKPTFLFYFDGLP